MRHTSFVTASLVVLLSLSANAQLDNCDGTTYDMSVCLSKILKKTDAELNAVYKQALEVAKDPFTPQDVRNLKEAERKWIAYRDAACKAEYSLWGGGTGGPLANLRCLIRITQQRIDDIKSAYMLTGSN